MDLNEEEKYSSCNHIFVYSELIGDSKVCGCIKCGLDFGVRLKGSIEPEKQAMYDYLEKNVIVNGIDTKMICNLKLGKSIYDRILKSYPDIDDETGLLYFKSALDNIQNSSLNNEIKISKR